eukprot:1574954-Amphidinium_carterae.1
MSQGDKWIDMWPWKGRIDASWEVFALVPCSALAARRSRLSCPCVCPGDGRAGCNERSSFRA